MNNVGMLKSWIAIQIYKIFPRRPFLLHQVLEVDHITVLTEKGCVFKQGICFYLA